MFNYANDFDFYRQWANMLVQGHFDARIERPYACLYVSRRDGRPYALDHDQVLGQFGELIVHQARMDSVFSAAIGDHGYVLRHAQLEPLLDAARRIQAQA